MIDRFRISRTLLAVAISHALSISAVQAATLSVTTGADITGEDGKCTLREAVASVNAADTGNSGCNASGNFGEDDQIIFPNLAGTSIILNGDEIEIGSSTDLAISGPIPNDPTGLTISANNQSRIFNVTQDSDLILQNLTLTEGESQGPGGAVLTQGSLSIAYCLITQNKSNDDGITATANGGGGLFAYGDVVISNSTISNNSADGTGASGGGVVSRDLTTISNSTISYNILSGISSRGGGLSGNDDVSLVNTTISSNQISGEDSTGGAIHAISDVSIYNSTITRNTASADSGGGGILLRRYGGSQKLTLVNTILSDNTHSGTPSNLYLDNTSSKTIDAEFSLLGSDMENQINGNNDSNIFDDTPSLGPLKNNGGTTDTHALIGDDGITTPSAAIDAGTDCSTPPVNNLDQRAFLRDHNCDIGAYEYQATPISSAPALGNISYNGLVPESGVKPGFIVAETALLVATAESLGLPNPQATLKLLNGDTIAFNDDCDDPSISTLIGRPLTTEFDACIVQPLPAGSYYLEVLDADESSGNALISVTQILQ